MTNEFDIADVADDMEYLDRVAIAALPAMVMILRGAPQVTEDNCLTVTSASAYGLAAAMYKQRQKIRQCLLDEKRKENK